MTVQTVYAHINGSQSVRLKATTTDGTEASVSTDQTPALSLGDWAGQSGVTITHAVVTADTACDYAYIRTRTGVTKAVIPIATTGALTELPKLPMPVQIEIGDVLRVMTSQ